MVNSVETSRTYVYASRGSLGARDLVRGLRAARVRAFRLRENGIEGTAHPGDLVVNWGESLTIPTGIRVLNPTIIGNKLRELTRLELKGVLVPKFDVKCREGWLGRKLHHTGGRDLMASPRDPDYWTERLTFDEEFRIHIFGGKSIRVGIKKPRTPHHSKWIRSYDAGWSIYYDSDAQERVPRGARNAARSACEALGYDFGAVDIGTTQEGKSIVLEVNSAPGLEGKTIEVYVDCIKGLLGSEGVGTRDS